MLSVGPPQKDRYLGLSKECSGQEGLPSQAHVKSFMIRAYCISSRPTSVCPQSTVLQCKAVEADAGSKRQASSSACSEEGTRLTLRRPTRLEGASVRSRSHSQNAAHVHNRYLACRRV